MDSIAKEAEWRSYPTSPDAKHITEQKIRSFLSFQPGWSHGAGVAFDTQVLAEAIELNKAVVRAGLYVTDAFPGLFGEIMVTIYHRNHYLEFIREIDGSITFHHERGSEEIGAQEGLSLAEALTIIDQFREEAWKQSEFSRNVSLTLGNAISRVLPSEQVEIRQESRWFPSVASSPAGQASVIIFEDTTEDSPGNRQYTGDSTPYLVSEPIAV